MKILLTGFKGYVGRLLRAYLEKSYDVIGTSINLGSDKSDYICDLRSEEQVRDLSKVIHPDLIIHAVGLKDIDYCEKHVQEAFKTNALSTENIVKFFGSNSRIIYISTDYVFDGNRGNYAEHEVPSPVTVYGKSKLSAEQVGLKLSPEKFIIVRTSALYANNAGFIQFVDRNLSRGLPINCYTDAFYSPTFIYDFLIAINKVIQNRFNQQLYHICGHRISRYEFAVLFAEAFAYDVSLVRPTLRSNKDFYLFPDLSLNSEITQSILGYRSTEHSLALQRLAEQRILV